MNALSSATDIRFLSGVPFFNNYSDTRYFTSGQQAEQVAYFNTFPTVHTMTDATFQRDQAGSFIRASASIDTLYSCNYVMFKNANHGDKWFYAFVTSLEYSSNHMTKTYIEIDVIQSWLFDIQIKPSYVEREHARLWDGGQPIINTHKEPLAYGGEYDVVDEVHIQPSHLRYVVFITTKQIAYSNEAGTVPFLLKSGVLGSPTPLYYYIMPLLRATMNTPEQLGGSNTLNIVQLMEFFATDEKAVNALQACYITDFIGVPFDSSETTNISIPTGYGMSKAYLNIQGTGFPIIYMSGNINRFYESISVYIDKYRNLKPVKESKLYMYPYTVYELQDFKGNIITFRPEYVDGNNIHIKIKGGIGFNNKVSYEIANYNNTDGKDASFQYSLIDNNPNDIPIVTDYLSAFLQGNRNSIQARLDNSQLAGLTTGMQGIVSGLATGMTGNPIGGVAMGFNGVLQGTTNHLAEMNSTNAQFEDAQNIPPSINKMGGNTAFDYGNNLNGVRLIKKQIKDEYIESLESYFKKYGYKTNKLKMPNLKTRQHFNFVKTIGITVVGQVNNETMARIKRIFDSGITLWHTNDIGNYTLENGVR